VLPDGGVVPWDVGAAVGGHAPAPVQDLDRGPG
jgi:hypothetical protein